MLVTQAIDHAQVRAFPAAEQIAGHDVFSDCKILDRAVERAVDFLQFEIAEIGAEEVGPFGETCNRPDTGQAIGLSFAQRVVQRHGVVFVELDVRVISLVAPAALEADLYGELAIVGGEAASQVELGGPFLVLRIRQRDEFDIVQRIGPGVGEIARRIGDAVERDARIGEVESDAETFFLIFAFECDGIEAAVFPLARFCPARGIVGEPITPIAFAAENERTDLLRFEAVLDIALDGNRRVLVGVGIGVAVTDRPACTRNDRIAEIEDQAPAALLVVELAVDAAGIQFGAVARAKVEAERRTDTFAFDIVVAVFEILGIDDAVVLLPPVGFDIVGLEGAAVIADAARNAEIVTDAGGEIQAALGAYLIGVIIIAAFNLGGQQARLAVERAGGLDLDRRADRVGIHVGGQALLDLDAFDDVAGDHVERHFAHVAFGCGNAHAVDRTGIEAGRQPAHGDEATFALIVQDVDTGQAAQALCNVLIGELTDRVAGQHIGNYVIGIFARQGRRLVSALPHHQDLHRVLTTEGKVNRDRPLSRNLHGNRFSGRTDVAGGHFIGAGRQIGDPVGAITRRYDLAAQLLDLDRGRLQCHGIGLVDDSSGDVASDGGGGGEAQRGETGASEQTGRFH